MELDKLLARLLRRKEELLKVLERPEIPLHTNASENDLRSCVIKRKISGGTMSKEGRIARDTMLGLMKTCKKAWAFLVALSRRPAWYIQSTNGHSGACRPHYRQGLIPLTYDCQALRRYHPTCSCWCFIHNMTARQAQ